MREREEVEAFKRLKITFIYLIEIFVIIRRYRQYSNYPKRVENYPKKVVRNISCCTFAFSPTTAIHSTFFKHLNIASFNFIFLCSLNKCLY